MSVYCGTDIIEVERIKDAILNNNKFKENIFSKNEIAEIDSIKSDYKYQRYAGRFAAKEAVFKALSEILLKNNYTINISDIEVLNVGELKRKPKVNILKKDVVDFLNLESISLDVSISHIKDLALATAVFDIREE